MIKKLINKHWDKALHYLVCAYLFRLLKPLVGSLIAILLVELIAFGKEIYDANHDGKFDWYDILADNLGLLTELLYGYTTDSGCS